MCAAMTLASLSMLTTDDPLPIVNNTKRRVQGKANKNAQLLAV
jgi:hypothetical protein